MKKLIALILSVMLISGCATTVKPNRPLLGNFERPKEPVTQIYLPAAVDLKELEDAAKEYLPPGRVFTQNKMRVSNTRHIAYSVDVVGAPKVTAHNGFLRISVPLKADAKGWYTTCVGYWHDGECRSSPFSSGIRNTIDGTTLATADVNVDLRVAINPDYSLKIIPDVEGKLSNTPHLNIAILGGAVRFNIDIADKIQNLLNDEVDDLVNDFQEEINEMVANVDLRQEAERQWALASGGIKAGDTWIQFVPEKVLFRGFHADATGSKAQLGLGFEGKVKVGLTKPAPHNEPLPPVETVTYADPRFKARIPLYSAFDDLESEINDELASKTYEEENYSLTINQIGLNGVVIDKIPAILIGVDFKGRRHTRWYDFFTKRVKGVLYFTAYPQMDVANQKVSISDFSLTSETTSILFDKGLQWIVNINKSDIKKALSMDLEPHIKKLKEDVNSQLAEGAGVDDFLIKGRLDDVALQGFYLDGDEIEVYTEATGEVSIQYAQQ